MKKLKSLKDLTKFQKVLLSVLAVLVIAGASIASVEMLRSGDENENSSRTSFKRESSSIDESSFEQESSSDEESSSVDCSSSSSENSRSEENSSGEESSNREESSSVDISNEESSSADSSSSSSEEPEKTPSVGLSYKLMSELDRSYEDKEDYYVMTGTGTCTDTCVVIPSEYNGLPVKMVYALLDNYFVEFAKMEGMTEEEMNEALEEEGMTLTSVAIEKLVIPDSVISIYAVCLGNLKELYIGKGVSHYDTLYIKNLQTLVVDEEDENYSEVGGNLHSKDGKTLISGFNGQIADGTEMIRGGAFTMSNIDTITIPDSVTSIGYEAFEYCYNLQYNEYDNAKYLGNENNPYVALIKATSTDITSCTIHNNTKVIANDAFRGCSTLTSVVIPDSVTNIGYKAFYGGNNLQYNEYNNAKYLGNENNPYVALIKATSTDITSCTIHNNTKVIFACAFEDCSSLTSVTIGNGVISIGQYAFEDCSSLTSVVIPDSVTSIGNRAFRYCSSLTSVVIGNSVTSIGKEAFSGCSSLTSVVIPDSVTSIGDWAFEWCRSLTSVVIPDSVTSIGDWAFSGCSLTSVVIPDSVTSIGYEAFYYCSSLTSVVIPDSVTSIGDYAFAWCSSLTSIEVSKNNSTYKSIDGNLYSKDGTTLIQYAIGKMTTSFTIPDSVTSIGDRAFRYCSSLTSVVIPDSVTSIGDYAFYGCSSLTSVVIPDSVTCIGDEAFYECRSLTSVVIPDSVTGIGNWAFSYCSSLTSVTIGNGVTSIDRAAFYKCSSLTSVVIPDSVTSIGSYAFYYCSSLKSITFNGTKAQWNAIEKGSAWKGYSALETVVCTDGTIFV